MLRNPVVNSQLSKDQLEHFIAQMVEISYRGNPFPYEHLYSKENIDNIIEAVYNEVS
jgi:hypothetical protein